MSVDETMKVNVYYGGKMYAMGDTFNYKGGEVKKGIRIDPDYMTWSVFDGFCEDIGLNGKVDHVWFKFPHQDMESIKPIFEDTSDVDIMGMCNEAMSNSGEVDIYIELVVPLVDPLAAKEAAKENDSEKDGQEAAKESEGNKHEAAKESEGDKENESEKDKETEAGKENEEREREGTEQCPQSDSGDSSDDEQDQNNGDKVANKEPEPEPEEEVIVEENIHDDPRFQTFFENVQTEEAQATSKEPEATPFVVAADGDDDELEKQCRDAALPSHVEDTDDEWDNYNITEKEAAREKCQSPNESYLRLLQLFDSGEQFKDQLLRYVLKTNFDVKLCKWEKTKLAAICTDKTCPWKIYCSVEKAKRKWMVKTYVGEHTHLKSSKARMLKQGVIARLFKDEARRRPEIKWTDIKDEIMLRYNLSVSKWICRKARRLALDLCIQTQQEQFNKLYDYEAELIKTNPRVTTEIVTIPQVDGPPLFDKFYVCFEPLRSAWKRCCRPIIGLDGAFLKWELKGEVLAAVGRDADNRIYPIAWAVVRVEDNESWAWFVDKIRTDLELGLGNGYNVISDKQKGLINVVAELLPNAEHRNCARHVFANWSKVYRQTEYEDFFWKVAYSYSMGDYNYNMEELEKFDKEAHEDLLKTGPKSWYRAFLAHTANCEDVSNNSNESFNRTIKEARKLPMISMLQEIRRLAMARNTRRHDETRKCKTRFPPNIMEIFEQNRKDAKYCSVIKSSESLYEVIETDGSSYSVCLPYRHCACNQWNLTGIPCRHAIHVITEFNHDPADYVDHCYLTSKWLDTYSHNINPVNGEREWTKTGKGSIRVPEKRKRRGRRKKYDRMKEPTESASNPTKSTREGRTITCSKCRQTGHNAATCTVTEPVARGPKRRRGRPRKDGKDYTKDPDDPWSIQNAPKRRNSSSQSTPSASASGSQNLEEMHPSTAPATTSTTRGRGRGSGRPRGRPRGRARVVKPSVPREYSCFISPWSGQVFEEWGTNPEAPTPQEP